MARRYLLAGLGLVALMGALTLRADEPSATASKTEDKSAKVKEELSRQEEILARRFQKFQDSLQTLMERLERSSKLEDRERAAILRKALEQAKDASLTTRFDQLVGFLKSHRLDNTGDIQNAQENSQRLADDLRALLALLREDSRAAKLREERLRLEQVLKEINRLIRDEKRTQGLTQNNKTEPNELKNIQAGTRKETTKVAQQLGKGKQNSQGGEAKDAKADAKSAGKGEGKKGEGKDAGKSGSPKAGEGKDAGAKGGEGKQGEAKGKQGQEGKAGQAKEGGPKGGEAKQGAAKAGEPKAGQAGAKSGEPKAGQSGAAKGGEKKGGSPAGASKAGGEKKAGAQGQAKAGSKGGEGKQAGAKGSKAGEGQAGAKSGGKSGSPGQAKAGKSGAQGQSKSSGQQGQQGQESQQAKDGGQKGQQPPQSPPTQDATSKAQKRVQEAADNMRKAEEKIAQQKNPEATDEEGKAIDNLEKAKKRLEDLLRQLREEELERLLQNLQARCEKMLAMQIRVYDGTLGVQKGIDANADKKASRQNKIDSLKLSDDEKAIVLEASKAIEMLEAEGSAVAFPEVFSQVREDMRNVQRRLEVVDPGKITQATEEDIIATLRDMIEALKKAQQQLNQSKGSPGSPPPNQDQKLLDQIAELKMIRAMQIRVNGRTRLYGRQYEGEQTADPILQRELRGLSDRQERIFEVTNRIVRGDNK